MEVHVCKALPLGGEDVSDGAIHITQQIPPALKDYKNTDLQYVDAFYENQAKLIVSVLSKTLPQGTKHKLLSLMLREWQNLYMGV